jgi:hypothetical protein
MSLKSIRSEFINSLARKGEVRSRNSPAHNGSGASFEIEMHLGGLNDRILVYVGRVSKGVGDIGVALVNNFISVERFGSLVNRRVPNELNLIVVWINKRLIACPVKGACSTLDSERRSVQGQYADEKREK